MSSRPLFIHSRSLSNAWTEALSALSRPSIDELVPLVVHLEDFSDGAPQETVGVRALIDASLSIDARLCLTGTTSNLIFPENLWLRHRAAGRASFFDRYREVIFPRLRRVDRRNARGTYFQRLIDYGPTRVNQLGDILDRRLAGNARRSALQAMIFDPARDHSNSPYLNFPCLDHVAFAPDPSGGLSVTAFYANQYVFDRAYGNYLGLCALGRFVASELSLSFTQLTCVAGIAQRGSVTKAAARELVQVITTTEARQETGALPAVGGG